MKMERLMDLPAEVSLNKEIIYSTDVRIPTQCNRKGAFEHFLQLAATKCSWHTIHL